MGWHVQAAYLLAVLAEHPCTHQLITAHRSIAALLQIMHSACKAQTTSRTLDLVSQSTGQQAEEGQSNSTSAAAMYGSDRAATALAASASPGVPLPSVPHGLHDAIDAVSARRLDMGGEEATLTEEVCQQGQPTGTEFTESAVSSAADAAAGSDYSMEQQTEARVSSSGSEAMTGSSVGSQYRQASTVSRASHGSASCSGSATDSGREGTSMRNAGSGDAADHDEEVSSSSIHSRLLRAARAAKASAAVLSAQAEPGEILLTFLAALCVILPL